MAIKRYWFKYLNNHNGSSYNESIVAEGIEALVQDCSDLDYTDFGDYFDANNKHNLQAGSYPTSTFLNFCEPGKDGNTSATLNQLWMFYPGFHCGHSFTVYASNTGVVGGMQTYSGWVFASALDLTNSICEGGDVSQLPQVNVEISAPVHWSVDNNSDTVINDGKAHITLPSNTALVDGSWYFIEVDEPVFEPNDTILFGPNAGNQQKWNTNYLPLRGGLGSHTPASTARENTVVSPHSSNPPTYNQATQTATFYHEFDDCYKGVVSEPNAPWGYILWKDNAQKYAMGAGTITQIEALNISVTDPGEYTLQIFEQEGSYRRGIPAGSFFRFDEWVDIYGEAVTGPSSNLFGPDEADTTYYQARLMSEQSLSISACDDINNFTGDTTTGANVWYIEVDANGAIITTDTSSGTRAIKNLDAPTTAYRFDNWTENNGESFYCESEWFGRVYRKADGTAWTNNTDFFVNGPGETNAFVDVKITGWGSAAKGDLILRTTDGSLLPQGTYGVCLNESADVENGVLTYPFANSDLQISATVNQLDVTVDTLSSGDTDACWYASYLTYRIYDSNGVEAQTAQVRQFGSGPVAPSDSFTFVGLASGQYTVEVEAGDTVGSNTELHEGIDSGAVLFSTTATVVRPWCSGDPWWFQVDANGKLVTTATSGALNAIRSCNGTDYGKIAASSTVFYCNATWSDNIFRKSGSGEWTSSTEVCNNNTEGEQLINVTISGVSESAFVNPSNGDIYIRENGSLLPAGYYGVCSPAVDSITSVLTNIDVATEDWSGSLSASVSGSSIVATVTRPTSCSDQIIISVVNSSQQVVGSVTSSSANWANNVYNATFNISSAGTYEVKVISTANTLEGLNAGVELDVQTGLTLLTDWCTDNKFAFRVVGGAIVEPVITVPNSDAVGIQSCANSNNKLRFSPSNITNRQFYFDAAWNGEVYAPTSGTWTTANDVCTASDSDASQIDVTLSGSPFLLAGDLKIRNSATDTLLADGWYGVCSTDDPTGTFIGTPQPNSQAQLTNSVSGQDLTVTATSVGNSPASFSNVPVYFKLIDSQGNQTDSPFVRFDQTSVPTTTSHTFTNLDPNETYDVFLKHGSGSGTMQAPLQSTLHEGVDFQEELDSNRSLQVQSLWCTDNLYSFEVDSDGKIITTVDANGRKGFKLCDSSVDFIDFADGLYCDAPITIYQSDSVAWTSETEVCASVSSSQLSATIKGTQTANGSGRGLKISDVNGVALPAGWYAYCGTETANVDNINVIPESVEPCSTDKFIYISSAEGDWDGRITVCDGIPSVAQIPSTAWYDESPLSGLTVQPNGDPWADAGAGQGPMPPVEACGLCPDEFTELGTVYVSGTLTNYTQPSERLRVYSSPGEQNPLAEGWYRTCSSTLPVANGVAPEREEFDCYGNPFIWYSTKNESGYVTDDRNYLTNGSTPWYNDAPLKDLTTTGCDLAIAGWGKTGDANDSTLLVADYTSPDNTQSMGCSGITSHVIDFNTSSPYLTRSEDFWYPNPETGQKIISSQKSSATEMTIALVVDCESVDKTIFKITDVSTVKGSGQYDNLSHLSAVVSSIKLEKNSASGTPEYVLTTTRNDFSSTPSNSISAESSTSGHRYEIIVIKVTPEGHYIRVNGFDAITDSNPSNFCSDVGGITNLNVEIGADKDVQNSAADMNFAEMIIYDEELNYDEIIELEGYLSHKWCQELSDSSHLYYSSGPICGECEDKCCESDITVTYNVVEGANFLSLSCSYKSSESMYGYQFKLTGLDGLQLDEGVYEAGESINSASGSVYSLNLIDPLSKGFKNYFEVTQNGVWVFGHFNELTSDAGDIKVFSKAAWNTTFMIATLTLDSGIGPNWATIVPKISVSEAGFNSPAAPHPLIVSYDPNSGLIPSSKYRPDVNGDDQINRLDAEEIVKRISESHDSGPYDLSGNSWLETIDARGKGWVDISDAVTCLLNIVNQKGTHLGDPIPSIKASGTLTVMSNPICSDRLKEMECLPCPCPEETEDEECLQRVWISDIEPADDTGQFGIVTVMYQSSCCIDGYKLVLGGFNDKIVNDGGGYHDGAIMVPSYGNSIGQLTDESETHLRGWLHGLTLNPEYDGEVAALNTNELLTINNNLLGDYNVATQLTVENKLLFPIVWGMSLGQNPQLPTTAAGKVERAQQFESGRLGINCIPATCKGESRVLTKFVINLRSFINPHISEFRLVTNDKAVTPCSFDSDPSSCSNITWTGDINDNGQVNGSDLFACLVLMYTGWSETTNWTSSLNDPVAGQTDGPFTTQIKKLNSEFDQSYLDIVDGLTEINHIIMKGQDAPTDKLVEIVPTDCCPCELPGDFIVSLDVSPCDCAEEGYVAGQEGHVTVTWTESTTASSYEVYRVIEEAPSNSSSYNPFDPFNTDIQNLEPSLLEVAFDNNLLMSVRNVTASGSVISDNNIVSMYKEKIRASKNPLDYNKWVRIYSGLPDTTTFIDRNPPKFKNCCPDDEMPSIKYIVVALNDCGEKNASRSYVPECCGHKPEAKDIDLGQLSVNSLTPLYSDVYHPFAINPYGGANVNATAQIILNTAPSIDTTIKLISWDGTVSTYTIAQGQATPEDAANALAVAITSSGAGITASASGREIALTQMQPTICGNTKITVVDGDLAAVNADEKFTGGNSQCNPASEDCETLAFFITSVSYSSPHNGDALFVGPSGGGQLPTGNLVGLWTWKPPSNYIGGVRFTYVVVNESGCSDEATISVTYAPPKLVLDCYSPPCDSNEYGKVFLKLNLPNNDNLAEFIVLRKPSSVPDWNIEDHAIKDVNGNYIKFNVTDYPDDVFEFVDDNVPMPDECCDDDLSYDYVIYYCESSSLKVGDKKITSSSTTTVALTPSTDFVCVLSTVCTVIIPCCGPPRNVLPTASVTPCVNNKYSTVVLTWDGSVNDGDNPYLYIVFRRKVGDEKWTKISDIDATLDGRNDSNPNWDSGSSLYRFEENIYTNNKCDDDQDYEYAIVTIDLNKRASGDPEDTDWANIEDGSPCSPGGLTVSVTVESCPPALCAEDKTLQACIDENYEYDLRKFVDCVPTSASGEDVSVSYSINAQAGLTNPAQINGSNLVFNTRNIASEGTATITIQASTDAPCASTVTFTIALNLVECGCPCPDDEADYTICDNNYINEEYASNDTTANELIGKLENTEQVPFSLTTKGGQTLRKGQPYVVSKGKIDCD